MEAAQRRGEKGHRRSRSEGTGITLDAVQSGFDLQGAAAAVGQMRATSLDTSCASQFLQSLQLHDAKAMQNPGLDAETAALECAAASPRFAGTFAVDGSWQQLPSEGLTATAGSKRAHSRDGRPGKDALQEGKKESHHQHKHSFTPALPAVEEAAAEPSDGEDDDYDYDSDKGLTPRARRSSGGRGRARRGGYNGRSENELLLLDPKRVKRILANRQSAARSKERRMNYTVQLESKLQSLSTEMDKLNAKMEGLQGQGKLLRQARLELDEQMEGVQQQLSETCSGNQVLISELFALQSALGLPQQLPHPDAGGQSAAAAAAHPHQQYNMQYNGQHGGSWQYDAVGHSPAAAGVYAAAGGSHPTAPGAAAAGVGSAGSAAAGGPLATGRQGTAAAGIPPLPPQHGRSPNLQVSPTMPQQQQQHSTGRQSPAMLQSVRPPSPRIPSPTSAAAATAAGLAAAVPSTGPVPTASTAAVAADMLLLDQFAAGGDDAAMACVDDLDPDMLATLLDDPPEPVTDAAGATAAGTGAEQHDPGRAATIQQQQQQPYLVAADPVAAAAAISPAMGAHAAAAAAASVGRHTGPQLGSSPYGLGAQQVSCTAAGASTAAAAAAVPGHKPTMVHMPVAHSSWSVQSSPGVGIVAAAGGGYCRGSPALSEPLAGEGFPDDVSSGSAGGGFTPSTRQPRMSDSSSMQAAGSRQGGAVPPAFWQQQQMVGMHSSGPGLNQGPAAAAAAAAAARTGAAAAAAVRAGPTVDSGVSSCQWGIAQLNSPESHVIQQQQQQHLSFVPPPPAAAAAVVPGTGLHPQTSVDHINFVMGANPSAARHRFGGGSHHRSASAGCVSSLGWTDADRAWFTSSPSMQQQQQQHVAGVAAAAGRLSAPGTYAQFDFPSDGGAYRINSTESMALLQQQQGMRQQQHRRSYSYAGSSYPAACTTAPDALTRPCSVGGDGLMQHHHHHRHHHHHHQQQQQVVDVHPGAFGPAGLPDMDYAAGLTSGHAGVAAAGAGAGLQPLTMPARAVTTGGMGATARTNMLEPYPLF